MSFAEVLLPPDYSPGTAGGPGWLTDLMFVTSGKEQRNARWERPLSQWEISYDALTPAEYDNLVAFFNARQGRFQGFRFFDWSDYSSAVAGVETKHELLELTSTTYQLRKSYASGGVTVYRHIKKPVGDTLTNTAATQANSTVRIWDAGTEILSGWTVDLTTGIVTFSGAPGFTPLGTFQFHVPARFDSDRMAAVQPSPTHRIFGKMGIVELKIL